MRQEFYMANDDVKSWKEIAQGYKEAVKSWKNTYKKAYVELQRLRAIIESAGQDENGRVVRVEE